MGWNEYLIKSFAYHRMEQERWKRARLIAYNARIGSHLDRTDPRSIPRTEIEFMPIGDDEVKKIKVNRQAMERSKKLLKQEREAILKKRKQNKRTA